MGWIVEIDPFNPNSTPRKRTALGRMNHEGAEIGRLFPGVRPALYMGDDAQNEYIYKFVSAAPWAAADATAADRLAVGDKYLDAGTLYVARFNADGTGVWLPLVFGQVPNLPTYSFADQADILINPRLAADALGATRMDRPEWTAVNPATGEMYCTLTNSSSRTPATVNASNPRAYVDPRTTGGQTTGNANGHVIRLRETGDSSEATSFAWDIYAFGAGADLDPANINLSGLDATNDFSSPDGLWFGLPSNVTGLATPLLWLQTDDGAYTDVTNCMMLAAIPGTVGDGATRNVTSTIGTASATTSTRIGKAPGTTLRRFLVGPVQCEVTGIYSTPDGRSLFVNIQHPGDDGNFANPSSNWPSSQTVPPRVPGRARPPSSSPRTTAASSGCNPAVRDGAARRGTRGSAFLSPRIPAIAPRRGRRPPSALPLSSAGLARSPGRRAGAGARAGGAADLRASQARRGAAPTARRAEPVDLHGPARGRPQGSRAPARNTSRGDRAGARRGAAPAPATTAVAASTAARTHQKHPGPDPAHPRRDGRRRPRPHAASGRWRSGRRRGRGRGQRRRRRRPER
jgi:hypothetical protein